MAPNPFDAGFASAPDPSAAVIEIEFEGERIEARAGESLAAALVAHGVTWFRTTRLGAARGLFCGMGVCQDCLVEVDGRPNQRACMTKVDRPLIVRREAHARTLAPMASGASPITIDDVRTRTPDLLIIGAGPAGLSAAISARRAGADVLVVDERSQPGGQFFKQLSTTGAGLLPPDAQHLEGAALIESARRFGAEILSGVTVWGAFAPNEFAATTDGGPLRLLPRATIIATGAYERGWPVPGWTLPGVMTTGAAQTLWRTSRRLPGRRVLIAGNGPLNLQLSAELIAGGAEVVAVLEASLRPGFQNIWELATMAFASPRLIRDGLVYHQATRSAGVPILHGLCVAAIEKAQKGLLVNTTSVAKSASGSRFEVDAVCLGYGFEPANELARSLGCRHEHDPARRHLVPRRDAQGLTDVPGIYTVGDCTGLGGARAALAEGTLVGLAAARSLGCAPHPELDSEARRASAALARHRRFQNALWRLYAAAPYSRALATPDTLICRCEEVSFGQIEEALSEGIRQIGVVKRRTRVGMGLCQGRYCGPVLDALLAERFGRPRESLRRFRVASAGKASRDRGSGASPAMTNGDDSRAHPVLPAIDTLVIGGGVVGCCLAGFLAEEGVEVGVMDDGRIGGSNANAGSLHVQMQSRFMRLYPQNVPGMVRQLPLYPRAVAFWQSLQTHLGADFDLKKTGGMMVAETRDQFDFLTSKAEIERTKGLDVQMLDRTDLDRIAPYLGPAVVGAEFCADEGKLNPLLCNTAIRNWIQRKGVTLLEGETAGRIASERGGFVVRTERGVVHARRVALAAGSGSKALAAELGVLIPAEAEPLHMNITEAAAPLIGHLVQHAESMITLKQFGTGQIVIGGGWPAHLVGDGRYPTVELASLIGNVTLAQHIAPRIAPLRILRTWAGINTTVDGKGVLGPVGRVPGLYAAIPGDAGYTLGPLSARIVADLMLDRPPPVDVSDFSPDRFAAPA